MLETAAAAGVGRWVKLVPRRTGFPLSHVQGVFARNHIVFEPWEMAQGKMTTMVYHAILDALVSLEDVSAQLMAGDAGITSVSWEPPKRGG